MKVVIPTEWKDVKLRTIQKYNREVSQAQTDLAKCVVTVSVFCDIDKNDVLKMGAKDLIDLNKEIANLLNKPFTKTFKKVLDIDGQRYGFVRLEELTTGEWVDLDAIIGANSEDIQQAAHQIMAILYRPITKEKGNYYEIEPYEGIRNEEVFLDIDLDTVQAMSSFFLLLGLKLQSITLKSIQEDHQKKEKEQQETDGLKQSLNSQTGNPTMWKRLQRFISKRH